MGMDEKTVFETPEFLALKAKWYSKLKKKGFVDIEFVSNTGLQLPVLRGMSATDVKKSVSRWGTSRMEYFRLAEHHLLAVEAKHGLKSWQYKAWLAHSEGCGMPSIMLKVPRQRRSRVLSFIKAQVALIHLDQQNDDLEGVV